MDISIRKAKLRDCKTCLELSKIPELVNPTGEPSHLWWIESFVKEHQLFFVAEKHKEIIGFIMGERTSGNLSILHSIVVKKEYQHKGIGKRLLETYEYECHKRKLKAIMLYGYAKNKLPRSFFGKNHYVKGALTYEFIKFL